MGSDGGGNGALTDVVFTIAIAGSDIYVGGSFENVAGIAEADYLAKFNGATWVALGSNGAGNGALTAPLSVIAASGTELYVGGFFQDALGIPEADYILKWDGATWGAVGSNGAGDGALNGSVGALAFWRCAIRRR